MHVDLRMLRALVAVEARGSIEGAARALSFSPAAVSAQLHALEKVCGAPLVERTGTGVRLTEAGRRAVPIARLVLAASRELERIDAASAGAHTARRGPGQGKFQRS
jgi:molybdate transport repressor ModE-like protein